MKSKISIITLTILIIGCIIGIVYLIQENNSLRNELASVINDNQSLNDQLTTNTNKISESETTITTLETTISELQTANSELELTISELQEKQKEADYFTEAEELWSLHESEFDCNWETFREAYASERIAGATKEEAYDTVYDLFKKQPPKTENKPSKSTTEQPQASNPAPQPDPEPSGNGGLMYNPDAFAGLPSAGALGSGNATVSDGNGAGSHYGEQGAAE